MKRNTILAGVAMSGVVLSLLFTNVAPAEPPPPPQCTLPADTSVKIGRAQIFTQNFTDSDRTLLAKTQYVWGYSLEGSKVAGTYTSFYIPSTRELNRPCAFGANSSSADYLTSSCYGSGQNQDWILWGARISEPAVNPLPAVTPTTIVSPKIYFAYKGNYGNPVKNDWFIYPPLDFSNPAVQNHLYSQLQSQLQAKPGLYDSFALDNASAYNVQDRPSGTNSTPVLYTGPALGVLKITGQPPYKFSQLTAPFGNGQINKLKMPKAELYSGEELDPKYSADFVEYMTEMTRKAHSEKTASGVASPKCLAANNKYRNSDPDGEAGFVPVANAVDITLDETGFTQHSNDATQCNPVPVHVNKAKVNGAYWSRRMMALLKVSQSTVGPKGLVMVDKTCYLQSQLTFKFFEWPLANFMMIKGDHSYLSLGAITYAAGESNFISEVPVAPGSTVKRSLDDIFNINTGSSARTNLIVGGNQTEPVYYRQFSKALAVVNPSELNSAMYTLPLLTTGYQYKGLFDGIVYANGAVINLPAQTAKVFVKVAVP